MSTRNVLIALASAALITGAAACGTSSTPPQSASNSPSATTTLATSPATGTTEQSACADLGGTVGADQTCRVHSVNAAYTLEMSFPLDYPDQKALTDVLERDRDSFVEWVAKFGSDGRGRPYEHVVTA